MTRLEVKNWKQVENMEKLLFVPLTQTASKEVLSKDKYPPTLTWRLEKNKIIKTMKSTMKMMGVLKCSNTIGFYR